MRSRAWEVDGTIPVPLGHGVQTQAVQRCARAFGTSQWKIADTGVEQGHQSPIVGSVSPTHLPRRVAGGRGSRGRSTADGSSHSLSRFPPVPLQPATVANPAEELATVGSKLKSSTPRRWLSPSQAQGTITPCIPLHMCPSHNTHLANPLHNTALPPSPCPNQCHPLPPPSAAVTRLPDIFTRGSQSTPASPTARPHPLSAPAHPSHLHHTSNLGPSAPTTDSRPPHVSASGFPGLPVTPATAPFASSPSSGKLAATAALFAFAGGNTGVAAGIAYAAGGVIANPVDESPLRAGNSTGSAVDLSSGGSQLQTTGSAPLQGGAEGGAAGAAAGAGGGSGGGGAAEEDFGAGLGLLGDVLVDNERLRGRLVALPNIVCRSANGDVFLVELG